MVFDRRVIDVKRVTKVRKGGKKMSFQALVAVGNRRGKVGVGVGKARDPSSAINKGITNGLKNVIKFNLTTAKSISHESTGYLGGAQVYLRPSSPGSGVISGGSPRVVLELAGVQNIVSKQLGSDNLVNNARATIDGLTSIRTSKILTNKWHI